VNRDVTNTKQLEKQNEKIKITTPIILDTTIRTGTGKDVGRVNDHVVWHMGESI
jgi:hypothetical protein